MADNAITAGITAASLTGIGVLKGLGADEREAIAAKCRSRRYKAGELVLAQDDSSKDVFLIISGKVRVGLIDRSGEDTLFREMSAGSMFV